MKVYKLEITRTRVDVGYVTMEAESAEDAIRKYKEPDYNKGEYLIFDDEIEWDFDDGEYDVEVVEDEEEEEDDDI